MAEKAPQMMMGVPMPVTEYNFPVQSGDVVKVRTTDDEIAFGLRGQKGKVVGVMSMVQVQFEDGTIETFQREQVKFREREVKVIGFSPKD